MSVQQYFIACCSSAKTKFKQLTCKHVYKEIEQEFLERETSLHHGDHLVEVNCYDVYAFHMNCIKCGNSKIQRHKRLMHKLDVSDHINTWNCDRDSMEHERKEQERIRRELQS